MNCEKVCVAWRDWIDANIRKNEAVLKRRRAICKLLMIRFRMRSTTFVFFLLAVPKDITCYSHRLLTEAEYYVAVKALRHGLKGEADSRPLAKTFAWQEFRFKERITKEAGGDKCIRTYACNKQPKLLLQLAGIIGVDAVSMTSSGKNALMFAVEADCLELVRLLLRNAIVDVNAACAKGEDESCDALTLAITSRCSNAVLDELLRREELVVSRSAVYEAVSELDMPYLRRIIASGRLAGPAFMAAGDASGRAVPALHLAVRIWVDDHVDALIEHGADVNAVDDEGRTALHVLLEHSDETRGHYVDKLLKMEALDVEAKTRDGQTALDMAWEGHHAETTLDDPSWWLAALLIEKEVRRRRDARKQCKCGKE